LIHGDLSVLERGAFRRTRTALAERDIWMRIAPHLVRPAHFVIPAHSDERPPWLLRLGLVLYDRLAPPDSLPRSATIDVTHHPIGNALKRPFGTAFEYSDCLVDDSRLVIDDRRRCGRAGRRDPHRRALRSRRPARYLAAGGDRSRPSPGHHARSLANASGAWTASVAETVLRVPPPRTTAVKMGQIIVRRLFETDNVYVLQNSTDG
jgi:glycerol-3-phosphate dehydrogenase